MTIPLERLLGGHGALPDFRDPIRLLFHCHARIEGHLDTLARVADRLLARGGPPEADEAAATRAALSHFALAGRLHTEDEEASLFPRLRASGTASGAEALAAVAELEGQHRAAEPLHAALEAAAAGLPAGEGGAASRFATAVADLRTLYGPHIHVENVEVFPTASRVLSPAALAEVGAEMKARRRRAGLL